MNETVGTHEHVTNPYYHSSTQSRSRFLSSASDTVPHKRKILDRWTKRITSSCLPSNQFATEDLPGKYIKSLSFIPLITPVV